VPSHVGTSLENVSPAATQVGALALGILPDGMPWTDTTILFCLRSRVANPFVRAVLGGNAGRPP
jgi:hypothetical protein